METNVNISSGSPGASLRSFLKKIIGPTFTGQVIEKDDDKGTVILKSNNGKDAEIEFDLSDPEQKIRYLELKLNTEVCLLVI